MQPPQSADGELNTWKEIAEYLGKSVRTAQEWEQKRGLPVKRMGEKGRVVALRTDLDAWKEHQLTPPPAVPVFQNPPTSTPIVEIEPVEAPRPRIARILPRWKLLASAVAAAVAAVVLIAFFAVQHARPMRRIRIEGSTLVVLDDRDQPLWSHDFPDGWDDPKSYEGSFGRQQWAIVQLTRQAPYLLFVQHPKDQITKGTDLLCFDTSGHLKWRFKPGREVSYGNMILEPPYFIGDIQTLADGRIILTANHYFHAPDQIAVLDNKGRLLSEYWHSGHLYALAHGYIQSPNVEDVLVGGLDNGLDEAELVVLSGKDVTGIGAQYGPEKRLRVAGLGPAHEKVAILFPRTSLVKPGDHNQVRQIWITKDRVDVMVMEGTAASAPVIIYEFDHSYNLLSVTPERQFTETLLALNRAGAELKFDRDELRRNVRIIRSRQ